MSDRLMSTDAFIPPRALRSAHLQSVLPSLPMRRRVVERRTRELIASSREWLLDCGDGVTLQAFHAAPRSDARSRHAAAERPPVVLLHGWEGSAESLYIRSVGQELLSRGHDVVRLNLRDHGETHHLNRELFHSCRLPEVVGAVRAIQQRLAARPLALVGYSLGGNFALRLAAEATRAGLRLTRVVAVSPVLDPGVTLNALECGSWIYHHYFILKWRRSLRKKQAAWPQHYDFGPLLRERSLRRMTADMVRVHTEFPSLDDYLSGYAITGRRLASLSVPATILTARDDPMIPPSDLERLARSDKLGVVVTPFGGHCGFLESLHDPSWADRFVLNQMR